MERALDANRMRRALALLDEMMGLPTRLIVGGGAAMVLAYGHSLATQDVDAFAAKGGLRIAEVEQLAMRVADKLGIKPDWLNAYFDRFAAVLPSDYASRLRPIYQGKHLQVEALGPEDLLIMKCFAGRDKDLPHARKLIKLAGDLALVDRQLAYLVERRYPGAEKAADYFDDLRDEANL
jgi:hypothetical protein